jgi:hypothetical protein
MLVAVLARVRAMGSASTASPGMVRTGMTEAVAGIVRRRRARAGPARTRITPEDMADVIAFLSGRTRYVSGHDLVVDGGVTGNLLGAFQAHPDHGVSTVSGVTGGDRWPPERRGTLTTPLK